MSVAREKDELGDDLFLYGTVHVMQFTETQQPGHPLMCEVSGASQSTSLLTPEHIKALHEYLGDHLPKED